MPIFRKTNVSTRLHKMVITSLVINIFHETCTIGFSTHRAINPCQKLSFYEKINCKIVYFSWHRHKIWCLGINLIPANNIFSGYNVNSISESLKLMTMHVYMMSVICTIFQIPYFLPSRFQNWYELQLQQIQQWLEKRPEFSLHAAQVQASRALTDVRNVPSLIFSCSIYTCINIFGFHSSSPPLSLSLSLFLSLVGAS